MQLNVGDKAPRFKTINQRGETVSLTDLKKKKLALYFYPQDDTPTCTAEACNLRDNYQALLAKGFSIYGISPDGVKSHLKFINKYELPFDLLVDENHAIAEKYDVWKEKTLFGHTYMGIIRTTFIIEKGIITDIITKVKSKEHAQQLMKDSK